MTYVLAVLLAMLAPANLDLPPEGVYEAATASAPAERTEPPPPPPAPVPTYTPTSTGGRCLGVEELLVAYSPGWSVERMSRIAYRESRCQADARNSSSSATGLLQILASHCGWLAGEMSEPCSRSRLADPAYNVRAAAALWLEQGYAAWPTP